MTNSSFDSVYSAFQFKSVDRGEVYKYGHEDYYGAAGFCCTEEQCLLACCCCCCPAAIYTAGREREWEEIERVVFGSVLLCSLYSVYMMYSYVSSYKV